MTKITDPVDSVVIGDHNADSPGDGQNLKDQLDGHSGIVAKSMQGPFAESALPQQERGVGGVARDLTDLSNDPDLQDPDWRDVRDHIGGELDGLDGVVGNSPGNDTSHHKKFDPRMF